MKKPAHLGFARKHRPQTFEEIAGQETIAKTLANAIEAERPAQAYLFFGPKGVGKTTAARILAKALNCAKGPRPTPCGKCPSCGEIAAGTSIDVLELDAASNTQVDKIREMIIETISLAPSRDRFKVFIIDEVHMLSTSSFNALLKTLEEPPPHAIFILATTEFAKIPATIVSRCQRFRFRPIPNDVVRDYLSKLGKAEKIKADKSALEAIARASGGSLRDALSLFEQAASFSDGPVTAKAVEELMGTLPAEFLLGIASAVLAKDAQALAEWVGKIVAEGFDPSQLLRDLRVRIQEAYLHRLGVSKELDPEWVELAGGHSPETFAFLLKRINRTLSEMRSADSPQLAFELGVYGMLEAAYDLRQWVARLEALENRLASGEPAAPPTVPPTASVPASSPKAAPAAARSAGSRTSENVWPAALSRLQGKKPGLVEILKDSRLLSSDSSVWTLIFKQTFGKERAQACQELIEEELSAVAGRKIKLAFEVSAPVRSKSPPKAPPQEGWVDASESEAPEDPGLKKVLGVMGGRVMKAKKKS